ncbi:aldose 1-epimerase family protein [Falsiroseomonas sp. E2-1-a4]|uniref:aldose 1-epimerase family protein n=1 Tax=Falsiroseomonas sp. E2-1-a4 TaxID=3239299 RepID=UPI003F2C7FDD
MTDRVTLSSGQVTVVVKSQGAELASLRDATGQEFLWQAGPEWPRHAPVLFPIVGRVRDDTLRVGHELYPMGQHGFARDSRFELLEQGAESCRFLLVDSAATHAAYPFAFRLEVAYALHGASLTVTHTAHNPGEGTLPFSIGAHPAFRWPLPGAGAKNAHRIEFEQEESGPAWRLDENGLIDATPQPFPVHGRNLGLREDLFRPSAIILLNPASRRLRYAAPGTKGLEVTWQGFSHLGLWMKPGAEFLCIEPWAGYADPAQFWGDIWAKPGMEMLGAGESRRFMWRVSLG